MSAGLADVGRLRPLWPLGDLVLNLLAFREAAETFRLDRGVVDEHVLAAAVGRDETNPFASLNHFTVPVAIERSWRRIAATLIMDTHGGLRAGPRPSLLTRAPQTGSRRSPTSARRSSAA